MLANTVYFMTHFGRCVSTSTLNSLVTHSWNGFQSITEIWNSCFCDSFPGIDFDIWRVATWIYFKKEKKTTRIWYYIHLYYKWISYLIILSNICHLSIEYTNLHTSQTVILVLTKFTWEPVRLSLPGSSTRCEVVPRQRRLARPSSPESTSRVIPVVRLRFCSKFFTITTPSWSCM